MSSYWLIITSSVLQTLRYLHMLINAKLKAIIINKKIRLLTPIK